MHVADMQRNKQHISHTGSAARVRGLSWPSNPTMSRSPSSDGPDGPRGESRRNPCKCSASRWPATRSFVPNPALHSRRATAADNTGLAPASAHRRRPRRTTRTAFSRTHRTPPRRARDSAAPQLLPGALRQVRRGHPHCRLPRPAGSFPHRHADSVGHRTYRIDPY